MNKIKQKNKVADALIILVMLAPSLFFLSPFIGYMNPPELNDFGVICILGLPVIFGLTFCWRLAKMDRRKMAWFCLISGLIPITWLIVVMLGIQVGWWY